LFIVFLKAMGKLFAKLSLRFIVLIEEIGRKRGLVLKNSYGCI
jgi:hypothetical protein